MVKYSALSIAIASLFPALARACRYIGVESDSLGSLSFQLASPDVYSSAPHSGRPVYVNADVEPSLYLYHTSTDNIRDGIGRWVINDMLFTKDNAMAYIDSWAVAPHLVTSVNDANYHSWFTFKDGVEESGEGAWVADESFTLFCEESNPLDIVFFESPVLRRELTGYFVAVAEPKDGKHTGPLYTKVNEFADSPAVYLFRQSDRWLIGEEYGVDAGMAMLIDDGETVGAIAGENWQFAISGEWEYEYGGFILIGEGNDDIYDAVRSTRSLKYVPESQIYNTLRNNVPIPSMGLGTGGLQPGEQTESVVTKALQYGYRTLDLAREYGNEAVIADIFNKTSSDSDFPKRHEVFIISKVWPTELGFFPTSDAIAASLEALNTPYIDMYLLHWPACDPTVSWMHCEKTVDPDGTWRESWRALEKAYAEGRVNSIGVSNFGIGLLKELKNFANVLPHLVQNHGEPGKTDLEVRAWCDVEFVVYQPYASLRNLDKLPLQTATVLEKIASERGVSGHAASLKFLLQTNAVVIPRASSDIHLQENLEVFKFDWSLTTQEMKLLGWDESLFQAPVNASPN